jgi:hypothetical protein
MEGGWILDNKGMKNTKGLGQCLSRIWLSTEPGPSQLFRDCAQRAASDHDIRFDCRRPRCIRILPRFPSK